MILKQEEDAEEAIRADIESIQVNGLQNIVCQYLEILKTKIEELERVKHELTRSNPYYSQLYKETKHWKETFGNATWNKPQIRGVEKDTKNMLRPDFEQLWENAVESLWKNVMEESTDEEKKSVKSQGSCNIM